MEGNIGFITFQSEIHFNRVKELAENVLTFKSIICNKDNHNRSIYVIIVDLEKSLEINLRLKLFSNVMNLILCIMYYLNRNAEIDELMADLFLNDIIRVQRKGIMIYDYGKKMMKVKYTKNTFTQIGAAIFNFHNYDGFSEISISRILPYCSNGPLYNSFSKSDLKEIEKASSDSEEEKEDKSNSANISVFERLEKEAECLDAIDKTNNA